MIMYPTKNMRAAVPAAADCMPAHEGRGQSTLMHRHKGTHSA